MFMTDHPTAAFLAGLPNHTALPSLFAAGEAIRSTQLDKMSYFTSMSPGTWGNAAEKHHGFKPMTLSELGAYYDNFTVGKYPCTQTVLKKALEGAVRYMPVTDADVRQFLKANPGYARAYITFSKNEKGKFIGHVLTTHPLSDESLPLNVIIIPNAIGGTKH